MQRLDNWGYIYFAVCIFLVVQIFSLSFFCIISV